MEFIDTTKDEDDDTLLDGKKKKKESSSGWPPTALEVQQGVKEDARKTLLDLYALQEKEEAQKLLFIPEESPETSVRRVPGGVEDSVKSTSQNIPEVQQELPKDNVNLQEEYSTDGATTSDPAVILPTAPKHYEDLRTNQPNPNSFRSQIDGQPESSHPVYGYNPAENEYYAGQAPGVEKGDQLSRDTGEVSSVPPTPPNRPSEVLAGGIPPRRQPNPENAARMSYAQEADDSKDFNRQLPAIVPFVLGYALKGYFAGRRRKREHKEFNKEISQSQKQIADLQAEKAQSQKHESDHEQHIKQLEAEQRQLQERFDQKLAAQTQEAKPKPQVELKPAVVYKPENKPTISPSESPAISAKPVEKLPGQKEVDRSKEAENLDMIAAARRDLEKINQEEEPKTRVEQDAWLRHELDNHGHEIQGQRRGQEYTHERAQELLQRQPQSQQPSHKAGAQPVFVGQQTFGPQYSDQKTLDSGQTPIDHRLPYDTHATHQTSQETKKQSALVATLTSPWTFLMLSLILLAYFIATLL